MRWRIYMAGLAVALSCAVLVGGPAAAQNAGGAAIPGPGCYFGEVVDGSTADDARRKIEAAGFTDVRALKKSCDNFWHGKASLGGRAVNVVLTPGGKVMLESN